MTLRRNNVTLAGSNYRENFSAHCLDSYHDATGRCHIECRRRIHFGRGFAQSRQLRALGGVGVAGTMSEGERALREILKQSDAVARLESIPPGSIRARAIICYRSAGVTAMLTSGLWLVWPARDQRANGAWMYPATRGFRALVKEIDLTETTTRPYPGAGPNRRSDSISMVPIMSYSTITTKP